MHPFTTATLACAASAAVAGQTQAAVVFTDNSSTLQASALASVGNPFSFDLDNPPAINFGNTAIPSTFGDTLTANASATDNDGTSTADFSSTIGVDISQAGSVVTVNTDLAYSTSQTASPGPGTDDFDRANAEGSASVTLVFDLDQDYNYTFNAPSASASGTAQLEMRLDVISGGQGFDTDILNQTASPSFSGFLPAGSGYKLVINVDDSGNLGSADGASASSLIGLDDAKLVLTPVPEPTSLVLLGLGGLLIARRRR